MKRFLPSGVLIFTSVLGIAAATAKADPEVTQVSKKFDLRETILRRFLKDRHCPAADYAPVFVQEADNHGLDWRLLPSLSMVESGGGKHCRGNNNNWFGWENGKTKFQSIAQAIHHVAETLTHGKSYEGKNLDGILAAYNHHPEYPGKVRTIMLELSAAATRLDPAELLAPGR